MRSPIVALALLATAVSARQAPFGVTPAVARASSSSVQQASKSALDAALSTPTTTDVNTNIAIRGGDEDDSSLSLMARLKIGGYFALWYILNVVYNSEYLQYMSDDLCALSIANRHDVHFYQFSVN